MPHPFRVFSALTAASVLALTLAPVSASLANTTVNTAPATGTAPVKATSPVRATAPAKAPARRYTYSPTLISRYTTGCISKVQSRGRTYAQAQRLCQCSIGEMQNQHPQKDAITLLIKSQFSSNIDPRTGLPVTLSKYFAPCKA
ncbi:MAG: hypothetical protein MH252_19270 [Thermosynechococcaceae cyanobacterium MS004]|nr:hypothetical protein [Thermosynechococcaceae cyanobacterium MS004]